MVRKTIAEINRYEGTTVNPMHSPDEIFELYSVPSFDTNYPEIIAGADIGSSKVTVQENDVLICKINPRINRVWVVKHHTAHPLLASSEWIVVRSPDMDADYLRWYFSSPTFRVMLNSEVAGIGGSLTRAQPKRVVQYPVPICSIEEQRHISAVLNRMESLISLRKQQIAKLDELVKARFVEMFGESNEFPREPLSKNVVEMFIGPFGSSLKNECFVSAEVGYCMVYEQKHAIRKTMDVDTRYVDEHKYKELHRFSVQGGDIIVSCRGTIGETFIVPDCAPLGIMHPSIMKVRVKQEAYDRIFFNLLLQTVLKRHEDEANGSGIKMAITATALGNELFIKPPLELQHQFAAFVTQTDQQKLTIQHSLAKLELLKKALMQKYFG